MSTGDNIFLATDAPLAEVAEWLSGVPDDDIWRPWAGRSNIRASGFAARQILWKLRHEALWGPSLL